LIPWVGEQATRIARARNLVTVARSQAAAQEKPARSRMPFDVQLLRFEDRSDRIGTVVVPGKNGMTLRDGDQIAFRITNRSSKAVDVTLLFVDANHTIEAFFPDPQSVEDNRVFPDQSLTTPRGRVKSAKTENLNHLVVVAVPAGEAPLDFTFLAGSSLKRVDSPRGNPIEILGSPLGGLLQHALYGRGTTHALAMTDLDGYALRLLSWKTLRRTTGVGK